MHGNHTANVTPIMKLCIQDLLGGASVSMEVSHKPEIVIGRQQFELYLRLLVVYYLLIFVCRLLFIYLLSIVYY